MGATPRRVSGELSAKTELDRRRHEGLELVAEIAQGDRIPEETAFLFVEGTTRPYCEEIREVALENQRERAAQPRPDKGKDYFIPLLTSDTFRRHPEILDLGLDRRLLALASDYLGSLPILRTIQVFWTPHGDGAFAGSQLYHFDRPKLGDRQLKLVVNLVDVTLVGSAAPVAGGAVANASTGTDCKLLLACSCTADETGSFSPPT